MCQLMLMHGVHLHEWREILLQFENSFKNSRMSSDIHFFEIYLDVRFTGYYGTINLESESEIMDLFSSLRHIYLQIFHIHMSKNKTQACSVRSVLKINPPNSLHFPLLSQAMTTSSHACKTATAA